MYRIRVRRSRGAACCAPTRQWSASLCAAACRRQCLVERSELEWLGDARAAGALEEPAHLLVHEVTRREDHPLGMRRVVAPEAFVNLLTRKVGHAHVQNDGVVFRSLQPEEG